LYRIEKRDEMNAFILAGIVGPWQVVLIVAIALLLFGGRKIPELMSGLGKGMKEFKKAVKEDDETETEEKSKIEK
jgi:sec-independent protein translocase protein TatA